MSDQTTTENILITPVGNGFIVEKNFPINTYGRPPETFIKDDSKMVFQSMAELIHYLKTELPHRNKLILTDE